MNNDNLIDISNLMRKRNYKEVKPSSDFFMYINEVQEELNDILIFLKNAEKDPKLLFTCSDVYLKSNKSSVYALMNHRRAKDNSIKGYDFQVFLAHLANQYFQSWLQENGILDLFSLEVRNANQFPSIFAVYHENKELLQFSILKKWYGVRERPINEEKIIKTYEEDLKNLDHDINEQELALKDAILRRDEPLKVYKGLKNKIQYFFINKKKLYDAFDKIVKKEEYYLKELKNQKDNMISYHPEYVKNEARRKELIEKLEPFFIELCYSENKIKSSLY